MLTALDVQPAVFVGTSRGGLLTMLLAVAQPTAIAGAVLNDIGPVIEPKGLARIKSYVGKLPQPKSFEEGAEIFRRLFGPHFTGFTDADWLAYSRRSFKVEQHRLVPTYDVRIAKTMEGIDFDQPLPPMWGAFDGLGRVPLMVLRGENSDLLSEATVAAMRARRPSMEADHGAGPGPRPGARRAGPDRPPCGVRRILRAGAAGLMRRNADLPRASDCKENPRQFPAGGCWFDQQADPDATITERCRGERGRCR